MKRIEAIIRPMKLDQVKIALSEQGVTGMTVSDVRGMGRQASRHGSGYGAGYVIELPTKIKLEMVVRDDDVEPILDTIVEHASTGEPGDGIILVLPTAEAIRIRTDERGEEVL